MAQNYIFLNYCKKVLWFPVRCLTPFNADVPVASTCVLLTLRYLLTKEQVIAIMTTSAYSYSQSGLVGRGARMSGVSARREAGRKQEIRYTDRVYARLTLAGHVVAEVTRERIGNFSSLIAILRALVPSCRGLARLTVRNLTRGWSVERPLMLYADTLNP